MQSMIVSQQQLMRRKTNDFVFSSSINSKNNNDNDKSSDEKKIQKDQDSNDELKVIDEKKLSSSKEELVTTTNSNDNNSQSKDQLLSPIRYRRLNSLTTDSSLNVANRYKKSLSWFNILPTYKVRAEEFKNKFGHIVPSNERFIVDYSCAYQREILAQGRMYISLNYICFYANILSWETNLVIKFKDIKQIYKTNTALIIPNAIEVVTNSGDKYFFASYVSREKAFLMLFKIWQNALLDGKLEAKDNSDSNKLAIGQELIWDLIHQAYGSDLGYTEEEEKQQKKTFQESADCDQNKSDDNKSDSKLNKRLKNKLVKADSDSSSDDSDIYVDSDTFIEMNNTSILDSTFKNDKDKESFSCCCDEHEGTEVFNETFPLTVDQMFTLVFDDSPFYRMIQRQRKSTVISCEQWRDVLDQDSNDLKNDLKSEDELKKKKTREVRLRLQVDNALAKFVNVFEIQILNEKSVPGYYYMIFSKCQNSGIPFGDNFQVLTQFCFSRGSTFKECKLTVHAKVVFVKSAFGLSLMKGTIESSSIKGITEYCNFLSQHLNNWCKEKSLERRQNLNFKQLKFDSSNEENNLEDGNSEDEDDENFVLSKEDNSDDDSPLINSKTNSINRKVFDAKRKRFKSSSISTLNSARMSILSASKNNTPTNNLFWKFKNNELILFVIFIILLLILVLILFLFNRLWQLEFIIRKYEEDLINFERLVKFTSNLSKEENFRRLFLNQSNETVLNFAEIWKDLINQTETTIEALKSIYLDKS